MNLIVHRPHVPSYLSSSFQKKEQQKLQQLPGIKYIEYLGDFTGPWALLSSTQVRLESLKEIQLKNLKLIVHANSGHDNFNKEMLKRWKIPLILGNSLRSQAVAEYILSAVFSKMAPLPHKNLWSPDRQFPRQLVGDSHIILFGYGHIGKIVYQALYPLAKKITVIDPYKKDKCIQKFSYSLLSDAAVVIAAMELNHKNRYFFNQKFFQSCPNNLLFINPSRGELVVEEDLIEFLRSNPHSHAVLDVFSPEPFLPNRFEGLKNITTTSHVAGVSRDLEEQMIEFEFNIIRAYIKSPKKWSEYKRKFSWKDRQK